MDKCRSMTNGLGFTSQCNLLLDQGRRVLCVDALIWLTLKFCDVAQCYDGSFTGLDKLNYNFLLNFTILRFVKLSSPYLNNLIILGSFLIYIGIYLGGLDSNLVSEESQALACQVMPSKKKIYIMWKMSFRSICCLAFFWRSDLPRLPDLICHTCRSLQKRSIC